MAGGAGDKAKEAAGGLIGTVFLVVMVLGVGWFIGFRPIEWVMDVANAAYPTENATEAPVAPIAPVNTEPVEPVEPMVPPQEPELWSCYWDPTMNDNWHDDVLCQRGLDHDRPELLTNWDFVTYDDMMVEAANYEAWLNSQ